MNENRNKENIIVSNRSAIHCLRWLQLGCIAVVLLDLLRFFELDITAVILGCTTSFILMSIPQAIMHFAGPELAGLRYVTIAAVVISSFLMNPVIGYESQLIYACPLLLSIQYTDRKLSLWVFFITIMTIAAGMYTGWITGSIAAADLAELIRIKFVPCCLMLACILPFILKINKFRGHTERRAAELQSIADHDPMTGLYSKHKFEQMRDDVYVKQENIGIVYFDINNLKVTNDNLGHAAGEQLINKAANSFKVKQSRTVYTYRMGGDEFMTVLTHCPESDVKRYLYEWRLALDMENNIAGTIVCEVSYGYAYGKGADINDLIKDADMRMYDMKQRKKRK